MVMVVRHHESTVNTEYLEWFRASVVGRGSLLRYYYDYDYHYDHDDYYYSSCCCYVDTRQLDNGQQEHQQQNWVRAFTKDPIVGCRSLETPTRPAS